MHFREAGRICWQSLFSQTPEFKTWYEANRAWLQPYAAFCFLRDLFGSAEHWKWGSLSRPSQQVLPKTTAWLHSAATLS